MLKFIILLATFLSCYFPWAGMSPKPKGLNQPAITAPRTPDVYIVDWILLDNISVPPLWSSPPITSKTPVTRGTTYYNWAMKSMVEVYKDFCIPIFPSYKNKPWNFPCTFTNGLDRVVYLTTKNYPASWPGPCCIFATNWYAPPPTFAQIFMWFHKHGQVHNITTEAFTLGVGGVGKGPFYYEFYSKNGKYSPASFAFPAMADDLWIGQFFYNYSVMKPNDKVFMKPPECQGSIPHCPDWNVTSEDVPVHNGNEHCVFPGAPPQNPNFAYGRFK